MVYSKNSGEMTKDTKLVSLQNFNRSWSAGFIWNITVYQTLIE